MATTLTVASVVRAGIDLEALATAADATGNNWATSGTEILRVKNAGGSPCNVTIPLTQLVDGLTAGPRVVNVPAGATRHIGVFPGAYADATTPSKVNVTYDQVVSVTVVVFKPG